MHTFIYLKSNKQKQHIYFSNVNFSKRPGKFKTANNKNIKVYLFYIKIKIKVFNDT